MEEKGDDDKAEDDSCIVVPDKEVSRIGNYHHSQERAIEDDEFMNT